MKTRFTHRALAASLPELNAKLEKLGHEYRFVDGHRYGYSAIDLATPEQIKRHCCHSMLIGGTPRECLARCESYVANLI